MKRKSSKHAAEAPALQLPIARLAELRKIIEEPGYVLGPQDEADLIDALEELIDMRIVQEAATVVMAASEAA